MILPYLQVGESVAKNSLFALEREKLKQAFILWLERNPLREEDLLRVIFWVFPGAVRNTIYTSSSVRFCAVKMFIFQTYIGNYWRVCMSSVVDLIELPKQLKKNMNKKALV